MRLCVPKDSTWVDIVAKSVPTQERKEERNYLRDWNLAVGTSVSAARDGEGAKLNERGKESMENEYKKIEGKKKGKNRVWGDDKN